MKYSKTTCLSFYRLKQVVCNLFQCSPSLFWSISIAHKYPSVTVNVFSKGSPSLMRRVLLISLGMTILPRSSDCVKQVQKIFVKPRKALKYKGFQLSERSRLVRFIMLFQDKNRHFIQRLEPAVADWLFVMLLQIDHRTSR